MKLTKEEAIKKIEELKSYVSGLDENDEWVMIDYSVIPKEVFERYGAKPFEIMKRKMRRENGKVWNNISWSDAKAEAKKLGYRLPSIQEQLVLLDWYKQKKRDKASIQDKEFLGIEELSYDEDTYLEWVDGPTTATRGGSWSNGAGGGPFALGLSWGTSSAAVNVGFRCAR